jgi:predicted DNA-binding transcriptional regulator YafY
LVSAAAQQIATMSRAERLLSLIEILRRHRVPVRGATIAEELGVSLRSVYRDIATLQSQGATIEGEAGVGYILRPGFLLPPLMFSELEIEAVVLGSRWVAKRGDDELARAARAALAKIMAVLPRDLRDDAESSSLIVGPGERIAAGEREIAVLRKAIRGERKLSIAYRGRVPARAPFRNSHYARNSRHVPRQLQRENSPRRGQKIWNREKRLF